MKKKALLKFVRNLVFFIGLIILTFWVLLKDQDILELIRVISSADDIYIILGIILMFLFYFMEAYNVRSILNLFNTKIPILSALKFTFIGSFFSAITPAASGGQPVEIYYMTKENIPTSKATIALLLQLCSFQICTIFISIVSAILNPKIFESGLLWLFLVGLIANGIILSVMLICIFSKKLTTKLINLVIKILKLFKLKNIDTKKEKIEEGLSKYTESAIFIKSHKIEFIKSILRVLLQTIFYYSIPFCVYKAFGLDTYNFFQIFTMQAVLFTTVSSLPLPGSIGISETVFLTIFGPVFGEKLLSGSMLLNRSITFYLFVIVGIIVVIFNTIKMRDVKGEIDEKLL